MDKQKRTESKTQTMISQWNRHHFCLCFQCFTESDCSSITNLVFFQKQNMFLEQNKWFTHSTVKNTSKMDDFQCNVCFQRFTQCDSSFISNIVCWLCFEQKEHGWLAKNNFAVNKPMRPRWKSLVFVFSASLNAHAPPSPILFSIKSFITKKQMTWGTKLTCQNNVPKSVIDFQCIAQLDCCQIVNEILCVLNKLNNQRCGRNKKKLWFKTSQFEFQKRCVCFKCTCQHCNFWTPNVWICVKHIVWLMKRNITNERKTRREWQTRKIKFSKCFVELQHIKHSTCTFAFDVVFYETQMCSFSNHPFVTVEKKNTNHPWKDTTGLNLFSMIHSMLEHQHHQCCFLQESNEMKDMKLLIRFTIQTSQVNVSEWSVDF